MAFTFAAFNLFPFAFGFQFEIGPLHLTCFEFRLIDLRRRNLRIFQLLGSVSLGIQHLPLEFKFLSSIQLFLAIPSFGRVDAGDHVLVFDLIRFRVRFEFRFLPFELLLSVLSDLRFGHPFPFRFSDLQRFHPAVFRQRHVPQRNIFFTRIRSRNHRAVDEIELHPQTKHHVNQQAHHDRVLQPLHQHGSKNPRGQNHRGSEAQCQLQLTRQLIHPGQRSVIANCVSQPHAQDS